MGARTRAAVLLRHRRFLGGADRARHCRARGALFTSDRIRMRLAILDAKDVVLGKAWPRPRARHGTRGLPAQHLDQGARGQPGAGASAARDGHGHLPRHNRTTTHMGGEGRRGSAGVFSKRKHVFANLGEAPTTIGLLAIRAAVAAGVNITTRSSTTTRSR